MKWNARWKYFLESPIGKFLADGDSALLWEKSDVPQLDMGTIARNVEELYPDAILFKFGLLPVWTSVGGNVIAYHPDTETFYWAGHERIFSNEYILAPETHEKLPLNLENLLKAMAKFSEQECGSFLKDLRDGKYNAKIQEFD